MTNLNEVKREINYKAFLTSTKRLLDAILNNKEIKREIKNFLKDFTTDDSVKCYCVDINVCREAFSYAAEIWQALQNKQEYNKNTLNKLKNALQVIINEQGEI